MLPDCVPPGSELPRCRRFLSRSVNAAAAGVGISMTVVNSRILRDQGDG